MGQPKLVVFELDFTLWDCGGLWVDCADFPFQGGENGRVTDSSGRPLRLYDEVPLILKQLEAEGIPMGLASRTSQPSWARDLLKLLWISECFEYQEIFPGSKVAHFENLAAASDLHYSEMLFFDDEHRNVHEVGRMGVHCVEVKSGISMDVFESGLDLFL